MGEKRPPKSLRGQMLGIVALGWLVPVVLVLAVMGWYMFSTMGQRTTENLREQLYVNLSMSADRLDAALKASRTASSNPTIKNAWAAYERDGSYAALYRATSGFLDSQYRGDSRFFVAAFWFAENPEGMKMGLNNEAMGMAPGRLRVFWQEDWEAAREAVQKLDTGFVFLVRGERVYLLRNVMTSDFTVIGTLALGIHTDFYFDELTSLPFVSAATVYLDGNPLLLEGDAILEDEAAGRDNLSVKAKGREYDLRASAQLDRDSLTAQFAGYRYILLGMLVLVIPLLMLVLWFFNRKVAHPVHMLVEGASHIESGELGYQLPESPDSREFAYLTESFNQMSGQLQNQFDRLYQEEVALRDAEIKALQAHINPHFLNNTLEIINWEARMSGDAKVSKMIEALSTVLDAALDRDKRPEVRLAEEMNYVNAYLYIVCERYGKRLKLSVDLPEDIMDIPVPRLILQPVIENAVEHGIGPGGQGTVVLRGRRAGDFLLLDIQNDGGLSPQDEEHIRVLLSPDYDPAREHSRNIGIANIHKRLSILYGPPCGLDIRKGEGNTVVARLTIAIWDGKREHEGEKDGD